MREEKGSTPKIMIKKARNRTNISMLGDGTRVDLQDVQSSLFIGQLNVCTVGKRKINPCFLTKVTACVRIEDHKLTDLSVQTART